MIIEIHQIEGVDPNNRSFNRNIEVLELEEGYQARARYEEYGVESATYLTVAEAVQDLVKQLQRSGFTRFRTRVNFKEGRYLAERKPWIEYPHTRVA